MLNDYKISESDITTNKVGSVEGVALSGTVPENKNVFDKLPMLSINSFNDFIDALTTLGFNNVVEHSTDDAKYIRLNSGQLELSANGTDWQGVSFAPRYVWFKYSQYSDGTGFHDTPTSDDAYLGIALTDSDNAPTDKANYKWSMFKSEDFQSQITALKSDFNSVTGNYNADLISAWSSILCSQSTTSISSGTGTIYYDTDKCMGVFQTTAQIASNTVLCTLPTGYRPTVAKSDYDSAGNTITIGTDGTVTLIPAATIASGTAIRFYSKW